MRENKRYEIFARDFFTCQRCGKTGIGLTVAHKIKRGVGSQEWLISYMLKNCEILHVKKSTAEDILDDPDNLVTACFGRCNDSYNIFHKLAQRDELINGILKKRGYKFRLTTDAT